MSRNHFDAPYQTPSFSDLWHQLSAQLTKLIRQELTLARTEIHQSLPQLFSGISAFAGGIMLFFTGFLLLLGTIVVGLASLMPLWLAALAVGVLVAGAGWGLMQRGKKLITRTRLVPYHVQDSLRRDKEMLFRRASR